MTGHYYLKICAACVVIGIVWWSISAVTRDSRSTKNRSQGLTDNGAESQWEIVENLNIEDDWHSHDDPNT